MLDIAYIVFICTLSLTQYLSYDCTILYDLNLPMCIFNVKDTIRLCFLQVADVTGS